MDGKLHFKNRCKELNIDYDELFKVGAQNPMIASMSFA